MIKIFVGVNTLSSVDRLAYSNHCQFWYRLGRDYPDCQFAFNTPPRMSIDRMRNQTAQVALQNNFDYVLFLDDDVLVPENSECAGLRRLLDAKADIAAGWTIIRGYPYENMFFRFTADKKELPKVKDEDFTYDEKGNIPCDAVGFSYCLISCDLLRKVPAPWFVTGPNHTEDVYFCQKAVDLFPETKIVVDPRVATGHILGSELVYPDNRANLKAYMEGLNPELLIKADDKEQIARGDEYVAKIGVGV